jgi:hypothetical protein
MAGKPDEAVPSVNSMQFLVRLQGGQFLHDLQDALKDLVQGVVATGKAGKINIDIVTDVVKNAPNAVFFKTKLSTKVPKPLNQTDLLFVGKEGTLHENDPRQTRMDFGPRPVVSSTPPQDPSFDRSTGEITGDRPRVS